MDFRDTKKALESLIRIEKNLEFLNELDDIKKIKKYINKMIDLTKDTKILIDKNGKVLPGLIMDEVTK
jgi:hypothetical protein